MVDFGLWGGVGGGGGSPLGNLKQDSMSSKNYPEEGGSGSGSNSSRLLKKTKKIEKALG